MMSSVYYSTYQSSSHDDHVYQNTEHLSPRQQLNICQDTFTESFTDLLMSSPLDDMFQDVLYNLPNEDSVDLAVDSDQCVEEPQDCVSGADLCYPSQHNGHYYSSASPDFGMVLTPDLTRLNPRFSPEAICSETSSISSLSHAQQHPVARKLIMSPEDFTSTEHPANSFQHKYLITTTDRKRKSGVLDDQSTEAISDHSSNSESSGVFSNISNVDHDVTSLNMSCIKPDNKRQRLDGCQDMIPEHYQHMHLISSSTECVSHEETQDSPLRSLSLDGDSSKDNTPQSASSPKKNFLPESEYLHVLSLPKPDLEMCQQPKEDNTPQSASSPKKNILPESEYLHVLSLPKPDLEMCQQPKEDNTPRSASSPKKNTLAEPEFLHVLSLPKPDPEMRQQPVQEICQPQQDTSKPATNSKAGKPTESHVELISRAIMESSEQRLVLVQYIYDNYPYFQTAPRGWRNTVRYNLSTNECFIKKGRAPSGRGFYWAIHPACVEDFQKGEFNRRLARQRVQYATRVGTSIHQLGLQDLIKNPLDGLMPPAVSSEILNPEHIGHQSLYHATSAGISLNDVMLPSPVPCRTSIMAPYSTTDNYACTAPQMTQSSCMTSQHLPVSNQTHHTVDPGMY